jgi:hypothetical protein
METSGGACPNCGDRDTQPVEDVWESRNRDAGASELARLVAPPTPRAATTRAGQFYLFGLIGLVAWVIAMLYVSSLVAARAASVFFVSAVAAAGVTMLTVRIFTGSPKPTTDQLAALEEWKAAHREWQQKHICLHCRQTFTPPS